MKNLGRGAGMGHPELSSSSHGQMRSQPWRGQQGPHPETSAGLFVPGPRPPQPVSSWVEGEVWREGSSATSADPFPGSSTVSIFHHLAFLSDAVCLFHRYQSHYSERAKQNVTSSGFTEDRPRPQHSPLIIWVGTGKSGHKAGSDQHRPLPLEQAR